MSNDGNDNSKSHQQTSYQTIHRLPSVENEVDGEHHYADGNQDTYREPVGDRPRDDLFFHSNMY
jgi:hypothetical protein